MKKIIALLLVLMAVMPLGMAEEGVLVNKIREPENTFAFAEDAALLEVYFPKIAGCDGAFVRYGDYSMIIDCGGNQWEQMEKMLQGLGVEEVTYAMNSHPDADHIGGFNHLLRSVKYGEFLLGFPEDYDEGDQVRFSVYRDLHAAEVPFRTIKDGDTIDFGDVKVSVYQRLDDKLVRTNNKSVMLKFEYGERSILFTGDVQRDAQLIYVDKQYPLKVDVLKFPHHGYNNMQKPFLAMVDPQFVVVTSGSGDAGGVEQLKSNKIAYGFTQSGIMHLTTDGNVWIVERIK